MVRLAYFYVGHSKDIPEEIKGYLCKCFGRILKNESPDHAFNYTKNKKGARKEFFKELRDADMASEVQYHRNHGMSRTESIEHVAKTYSSYREAGKVNENAVKKAYQRYYPADKVKK